MKKENIKFKAKRLDNGEWIIGSFVVMKIPALSKTTIGIVAEGGATLYEVALSTVCQFIGFLDKNGKEIYEGDVVEVALFLYVMVWSEVFSAFRLRKDVTEYGITPCLEVELCPYAVVKCNIHDKRKGG